MAAQTPGKTFFSPWAPPPGFAEGPADSALEQRISKLAEFAAKNGPPFVEMIRQKQAANPEYAFLNGGLGADYFTWRLYCSLYNLHPGAPPKLFKEPELCLPAVAFTAKPFKPAVPLSK